MYINSGINIHPVYLVRQISEPSANSLFRISSCGYRRQGDGWKKVETLRSRVWKQVQIGSPIENNLGQVVYYIETPKKLTGFKDSSCKHATRSGRSLKCLRHVSLHVLISRKIRPKAEDVH